MKRQPDKAVKAVMSGTWRTPPAEQDAQDVQKLLAAVADALNACDRAGFTVKLAHGAALTRAGYVIPIFTEPGERYAVRTMALTEFPVAGEDED